MFTTPLPTAFYDRPTVQVAQDLLGKTIVRTLPGHGEPVYCQIVETEAYTQDDPACHAFKGNKGRARMLYGKPGLAYVYFIYGMYHCFNVVTEAEGTAGAVLIRAVMPLHAPDLKTNGPGRLCRALHITTAEHNGLDVTRVNNPLYVAEGEQIGLGQMVTTTRIGISVAKAFPWRFYIRDHAAVSIPCQNNKRHGAVKGKHQNQGAR